MLIGARHADAEDIRNSSTSALSRPSSMNQPRLIWVVRSDRDVGANGEAQEERLLLAVLRHEANSVQHGVMWAVEHGPARRQRE